MPRIAESQLNRTDNKDAAGGLTGKGNKEEWFTSTLVKEVSTDQDEKQLDNT